MLHPFLVGSKLYLRALTPADLEGPYLGWLNDQQTTRFLDTGRFATSRASLEHMIQAKQPESLWLAMVARKTDRHIGNIKLGPIDWVHRHASLGILIGDRRYRGKGYAREALTLVVKHAFAQLGLHKITAGAYGDHAESLALFTRFGFVIEGRQRQQLFRDGAYHDKVLMGLLREDFCSQQVNGRASARVPVQRVKGLQRPAR